MKHRHEISTRLRTREYRIEVWKYLNENKETTSSELQKYFNIDKSLVYKLKYEWRKKNGYV